MKSLVDGAPLILGSAFHLGEFRGSSHDMNQIPDRKALLGDALPLPEDAWGKLLKLATMIEFDGSGTLTICNGEARISLGSDGVVRVEGKKIIQMARQNIALDAAYIDLN